MGFFIYVNLIRGEIGEKICIFFDLFNFLRGGGGRGGGS